MFAPSGLNWIHQIIDFLFVWWVTFEIFRILRFWLEILKILIGNFWDVRAELSDEGRRFKIEEFGF